jgi:CubicO group peptidase (beta-lactamase class C family)
MADLVRTEITEPLALDGMHIGAPVEAREQVAEPVGGALRQVGSATAVLAPVWTRTRRARPAIEALHVDGFHRLFEGPEPPIWTTEMPAVNGTFSADALARLYGALANDGEGLLSPATTRELGRVQLRTADGVLGLRMRWRLGYHHAFGAGHPAPMAFGHYGYGGSGGWADPDLGLSLGFVTNRIGSLTTPLGDLTLFRLNKVVRECARRTAFLPA